MSVENEISLLPLPKVRVLGVKVDILDRSQFLEAMTQWVAERVPRQVVTVNPEFVMRAQVDSAFARVLEEADMATPDGVGVVWAIRRKGIALPERVGGADVAEPLAAQAARLGHRLYLLGAAEGVAAEAARRLQQRYHGLQIAGVYAGSPAPSEEEPIIERVRASMADILLVAYGSPAQDFWIARNKDKLGVPVMVGVGGTLDYIAGVQRRAPLILRKLWLDWAFRLMMQPWRWRRMLALPRFVRAVLAEHP